MISDVETYERNIQKFGSVTVFFSNPKVISKVVIRNNKKATLRGGFLIGGDGESIAL